MAAWCARKLFRRRAENGSHAVAAAQGLEPAAGNAGLRFGIFCETRRGLRKPRFQRYAATPPHQFVCEEDYLGFGDGSIFCRDEIGVQGYDFGDGREPFLGHNPRAGLRMAGKTFADVVEQSAGCDGVHMQYRAGVH
nr:hypothetical protein [Oceanidesulfovibrio indonesiensis]